MGGTTNGVRLRPAKNIQKLNEICPANVNTTEFVQNFFFFIIFIKEKLLTERTDKVYALLNE